MKSFNFHDWIVTNIDPVIQNAIDIIEKAEKTSGGHQAVMGYWQNCLTDYGYMETYTKLLHFYPAWLYLVLVSMSELLNIKSLNEEKSRQIIEDLFVRIEESEKWIEVEFVLVKQELRFAEKVVDK